MEAEINNMFNRLIVFILICLFFGINIISINSENYDKSAQAKNIDNIPLLLFCRLHNRKISYNEDYLCLHV